MKKAFLLLLVFWGWMSSCTSPTEAPVETAPLRLASFHGTATELLFAMGMGEHIVVRDVTSSSPEAAAAIPAVGHPSQITVEPVLAYAPDVVVCTELLEADVRQSFAAAGIEVIVLPNPDTPENGKLCVDVLSKRFATDATQISTQFACFDQPKQARENAPSALFLYGHPGNSGWMVAGSETAVSQVLSLGGFRNPAAEMSGFNPLTPEALVAYNPDYIVLFDHTFESLGGIDGLLVVPGMAETTAGARQQILHFPGQAMNGFGLQTCDIINRLQQISTPS